MANNSALFNAALQGALGGSTERWISSPTQSSYVNIVNSCVAFATAVDAAIPQDGTIANIPPWQGTQKRQLLISICQGVCSNRNFTSSDSSRYTDIAAAVAALYNQAVLSLL